MSETVRFQSVSKAFGPVQALSDVTFAVESGSIHAVVGENGAGKTTLMNLLYGVYRPDSGEIRVNQSPVAFLSSRDAATAGVGMVSQHYGIIPELTCLENLILGAEPSVVLNLSKIRKRADELAAQMDFQIPWTEKAELLSPSAKQRLEILKLLWREAKVMILDEPTAMLSPADGTQLFRSLVDLADRGATVILVTHRVQEVMEHCHRVSVLRGGKLVADLRVRETNPEELAKLIVGDDLEGRPPSAKPAPQPKSSSESLLSLSRATIVNECGRTVLSDISLDVVSGECVGIAGVDGNGQRELIQTLLGLTPLASGTMRLFGALAADTSTRERIHQGLRLVPEDRHQEAVIQDWTVEENSALGLQFLPPLCGPPNRAVFQSALVDRRGRRNFASKIVDRFRPKWAPCQA